MSRCGSRQAVLAKGWHPPPGLGQVAPPPPQLSEDAQTNTIPISSVPPRFTSVSCHHRRDWPTTLRRPPATSSERLLRDDVEGVVRRAVGARGIENIYDENEVSDLGR